MKKTFVIDFICYAIILLFLYAAFSKLLWFDVYVRDLKRSPYIDRFAPILSLLLPLAEIVISVMLYIERTRLKGLIAALVLMTTFSIYVGLMIGILESRPCTCGGLIRDLTWRQHFVLNVFYTLLAVTGVYMQKTISQKKEMIA